jgi:uncharacterized protein YsxB (DUF464 family)
MLKITLLTEGEKLSLKLEGHAGYAEPGKDIVCASASILAYTLASIVDSFDEIESAIDLTSGDTTIECECNTSTRNAFAYTKVGYALLAQNYPQYVRLIES